MRRVVCDPEVLGGKPVIEGTRMSVEQVLGLLAKGMTAAAVVQAYPHLSEDDVYLAIDYARRSLENEVVLDVGLD